MAQFFDWLGPEKQHAPADQLGRCTEGGIRPDLGRSARGLGRAVLRELAGQPETAAAQANERFAEMIQRQWCGITAYCRPESKVSLGFVDGLNNKSRVFQRRAHRLKDEEYLWLKVLSCMLPAF